ncbi:MAG: histone deacetylase family protein [Alphaproteobacteria bacterium]
MHTLLISHTACLEHAPNPWHPESPDRLRAIQQRLEGEEFALLHRAEARPATRDELVRAHDAAYVDRLLERFPEAGGQVVQIDADTAMGPGTGEAALRAAGAACQAVDEVMEGGAANAFCAVRPPGHHATQNRAMGFCFFNNVAVAAFHARAKHGVERAAVIDFDVHHGNGTQDIFWNEPALFYASVHQSPAYPGTGAAHERGAAGNVVNVPLPPGADGDMFREALDTAVLPAVEAFRPGLILISAGFDAHASDPLAHLRLQEADFAWATSRIAELARGLCGGRIVSTLEGGYDLSALASSVAAHVRTMMEG